VLLEYEKSRKIRIKTVNQSGNPVMADIQSDAYEYFESEVRTTSPYSGNFTLIAPDSGRVKFTIRAKGYKEQTIKIRPSSEPLIVNIVLLPE
jgi:hypothetical protein